MLFTSREVRWFLDSGGLDRGALNDGFCKTAADGSDEAVPAPAWQGRLDGQPDIYLLVPDAVDMGIKWREGLLQIKGRTRGFRDTAFGAHTGHVECWAKWSYSGLPSPWRELFALDAPPPGISRIPVHKRRLLRTFRLDPDGHALEVDVTARLQRGVAVELTEVSAGEHRVLTLGFEAFPDDDIIAAHFGAFVTDFLASLETTLGVNESMSYPAWLAKVK